MLIQMLIFIYMAIRAAGILLVNKGGQLLVLHRKGNVPEGNRWGLPGGKVAEGASFIDTAVSKTRQEIGLEFNQENLTHLGTFNFYVVRKQINYDVWLAETTLTSNSKIDLNLEGHDKYKWESPEVLLGYKDLMVGMYPILEKYLQFINL